MTKEEANQEIQQLLFDIVEKVLYLRNDAQVKPAVSISFRPWEYPEEAINISVGTHIDSDHFVKDRFLFKLDQAVIMAADDHWRRVLGTREGHVGIGRALSTAGDYYEESPLVASIRESIEARQHAKVEKKRNNRMAKLMRNAS